MGAQVESVGPWALTRLSKRCTSSTLFVPWAIGVTNNDSASISTDYHSWVKNVSAEGHERTDRAVVIDGRRNDEVVESVLYRDYDSVTGQQGPDRLDGCPGVMGLHGR